MKPTWEIVHADCLEYAKSQPDDSVDMTFGSPPYEAARTYGIDFKLRGQDWVDWMVERISEFVRITSGLVAMVLEGQTRQYRWSAVPALLMADLHRRGIHLRKPPIFKRIGIPGSGGPDWLRNDYEFIVCCTKGGKLPWSDNTAMGHPPKWAPGGEMSHRHSNGSRVNQWGHPIGSGATTVDKNGRHKYGKRSSHVEQPWGKGGRMPETRNGDAVRVKRRITKQKEGMHGGQENTFYSEPVLANPGNVIKCNVGGGVMGDDLCHENEAPFPEKLAEFFVRSFCKPGGLVFDPFSGSGTTGKVAVQCGRRFIGTDVRDSQVALTSRRLQCVQQELFE